MINIIIDVTNILKMKTVINTIKNFNKKPISISMLNAICKGKKWTTTNLQWAIIFFRLFFQGVLTVIEYQIFFERK